MKNKELYKCPKCGSEKFNLEYRVYSEEDKKEFEEETGESLSDGGWLNIVCIKCSGDYLAFETDELLFKYVEKSMIEEELEQLQN